MGGLSDRRSHQLLEEPWAELRIDDSEGLQALAEIIRHREIDVVFVGPVTAAGMVEQARSETSLRSPRACRRSLGARAGR